MAGFNRRALLKRFGAGVASSAIPGGTGVGNAAKIFAGLGDSVGSAMKSIRVDCGIFANGVEMIKDGVYKFKRGWLDDLGSADLYKYLGVGDNELKEINNARRAQAELSRDRQWDGGEYRWKDQNKKNEYDRLDRSIENRFKKLTISDEEIGEVIAKTKDGSWGGGISSMENAVHWMKKNGADSKSLLRSLKSYVKMAGGAKKVMEEIQKYLEYNEASIDDILQIPGVRDVLPELDEIFVKNYKDTRRRYDDEENEESEVLYDEPERSEDDYGRDLEPDWYDRNQIDIFRKSKERFHESKTRKTNLLESKGIRIPKDFDANWETILDRFKLLKQGQDSQLVIKMDISDCYKGAPTSQIDVKFIFTSDRSIQGAARYDVDDRTEEMTSYGMFIYHPIFYTMKIVKDIIDGKQIQKHVDSLLSKGRISQKSADYLINLYDSNDLDNLKSVYDEMKSEAVSRSTVAKGTITITNRCPSNNLYAIIAHEVTHAIDPAAHLLAVAYNFPKNYHSQPTERVAFANTINAAIDQKLQKIFRDSRTKEYATQAAMIYLDDTIKGLKSGMALGAMGDRSNAMILMSIKEPNSRKKFITHVLDHVLRKKNELSSEM